MLTVISPAKKLDMSATDVAPTQPMFQEDANRLAKSARRLSVKRLGALMSMSDALAKLNYDRFRAFEPASTPCNSKPAALCFAGDTYTGFEAASLDPLEMEYAQSHLRILSGLYGLLRPLDAIQPYRLEMGSRLQTGRTKSLYAYWGDRIARQLNDEADAQGTTMVVNCASQEYFGAVDIGALGLDIITPTFLEDKPAGPKVVSFFAKQARGAMARFIVQNHIVRPSDLTAFAAGGYRYVADVSTPLNPVFLRPEAAAENLRKAS